MYTDNPGGVLIELSITISSVHVKVIQSSNLLHENLLDVGGVKKKHILQSTPWWH